MTRQKHISRVNEQRRVKSDERVLAILNSLFISDYRKSNGALNISRIAQDSKVKRDVVYRVLKQYSFELS